MMVLAAAIDWAGYALVLAVLVTAVALAWAFDRIVLAVLRSIAARTRTTKDDALLALLHRPLLFLVATGLAAFMFRRYPAAFPGPAVAAAHVLEVPAIVLAVAYGLTRVARAVWEHRGRHAADNRAIVHLGARMTSIAIYVVAFLLVLDRLGLTITPLLTSLGIAGLAVALALQDTLSNFFAGLWIQTGRPMQPGHYIRVEGRNAEGYVVGVGWRTTQLRTLQNNLIVIPNAELARAVVTDHDLPTSASGVQVSFNAGFEADIDQLEQVLHEEAAEAARTVPGVLAEPAPTVRFHPGFGDFGLGFTVTVHVATYVDQFRAQHEIRKRILGRMRQEGIPIADPKRPAPPPGAAPTPAPQRGGT